MRNNRWRNTYVTITVLVLSFAAAVANAAPGVQLKYDAAGHLVGVYNLYFDPNNCGSVGRVCPLPQNGQTCCVAGVCGAVTGTQCTTGDSGIMISIDPATATVFLGQTQQFTATVQGAADTSVTWQVNDLTGGYTTLGTIDGSGLYTAPTTNPGVAIFVTAVSNADPMISASATVTLVGDHPPSDVAPHFAALSPGEIRVFTAVFEDSSDLYLSCYETSQASVSWQVNGIPDGDYTVGTICNGMYFAPWSDVVAPDQVTITAISNFDSSLTATATVKLWRPPPITVFIVPMFATVYGTQSVSFGASIDVPPYLAQGVFWEVEGAAGGYPQIGTISEGTFTAPDVIAQTEERISAASYEDSMYHADAIVTILPLPPIQTLPASAFVQVEQTQQFTASIRGSASTAVVWKVNDIEGGNPTVGTIDVTGLYTAPATVPSLATVTVTAVDLADNTSSASSTVTVTQLPPIYFEETTLGWGGVPVGQSVTYSAHVRNAEDTTLTWQVNGIAGGDATVGTITADGVYVAPTNATAAFTVTVTAIANADSTKSISGTVTVVPIPPIMLYVTNGGREIKPCATLYIYTEMRTRFSATIRNTADNAVTWQVNGIAGGNEIVGTIDSAGYYQAPAVVPTGTEIYVMAALKSDPRIWFPVRLSITQL